MDYQRMYENLLEITERILVLRGSAGSGNYGHDGRPGKKGGSTKGGGLRRIGTKKDTPPGDRKKAAKEYREKRKEKKTIKNKIKETAEMKKFQKQAKTTYESGKGVDISAVLLGWKIGAGPFNNNVIVNPGETKKVKILAETGDRKYRINFNGKVHENVPAKQIAQAIIVENWSVGTE